MQLLRTEKDELTKPEIIKYIRDHMSKTVPNLNDLWRYYKAKNVKILDKPKTDPNNPDNRTPVGYGRKIVNTFTGYAYRPKYITYKVEDEFKTYREAMAATHSLNKEHIKTHRAGRNTAIFGVAYEIVYVEGQYSNTETGEMQLRAEPRFFGVDPREMILLHDYAPEPKKKIAIRYYDAESDNPQAKRYKVEVYYMDRIETYDLYKDKNAPSLNMSATDVNAGWRLENLLVQRNFFDAIPVAAYYFGDDMMGLIEPVIDLIDDYDLLVSDSLNEFDRFAHAYLKLVKFSLTNVGNDKTPGVIRQTLRNLKKLRVFENLPSNDAVSFLTKDIPSDYIEFMTDLIRNQIHEQSHVPDFTDKTFASDISGVAVQRLLFDFENVVTSAEANFDEGLYERFALINTIYTKAGRGLTIPDEITINHRRNLPSDLREFAEIAKIMKAAGFSDWLIAEIMPDPVIPDPQEELDRQQEQRERDLEMEMPAEIGEI